MALPADKQFLEAVRRSSHILVTFRRDWSVDAVASALAVARILEKKGKRVEVVADGFVPTKQIGFLPQADAVKPAFNQLQKFIINLDVSRHKIDELSYDLEGDRLRIYITPKDGQFDGRDVTTAASDFKYDLIISVDTPDYPSLGGLFTANTDFFYHRPVINIDSDPANENYGNINAVDITATSSAEVVYSLFKSMGEHFLDEDIATCLLAGMIAKTRSFKTPSVTPKTLEAASELMAAGARRDEIVQNLYRTRSLSTLKLWGRALARLKYDAEAKFAWTLLVRQDFIHAGAKEEFLPDVIDELIANSPEAEIIGILYEQEHPTDKGRTAGICALVSSEKYSDAQGLVSSLRPDGTRKLARICFPGANLIEAEKSVIAAIYKTIGKERKEAAQLAAIQPLAAELTPAAPALPIEAPKQGN